ncbi:MAG: tetratricopeptide repeat protein [Nitrospira sp.]|nr:tetratricopeptide repeat protein [Nitrospira sp.]MCP9462383.1 tetratricopeptide repeat protein [Nitrospira sp.]MCP9475196.1 tetratricopeptide repeat protein [Nitrospira sp.]
MRDIAKRTVYWAIGLVMSVGIIAGCGQRASVRPSLPPSASDLVLLKSTALCEQKAEFLKKHASAKPLSNVWGSGREITIPQARSASQADESYFFDEEGVLVGALFTFPKGLDLGPYPVLRDTLSRLKPAVEFYLTVAQLETASNLDASAIFETGDEKSTTQYLVTGPLKRPVLLQASFAIDPYVRLFSPYRREFLNRLQGAQDGKGVSLIEGQGSEDKEPFPSLQQFARGQAAQLAYCGDKNYEVAVDAYQKAIASGFSNKVLLAESHHKLGLSWAAKGQLEKAKTELLQSLAIRPNVPEVLNNLGTVHIRLGEKSAALRVFERAVTLRPNYAVARYNLAEASEESNPRRALAEYQTFLALVEGNPEEEARAVRARERIKALKP